VRALAEGSVEPGAGAGEPHGEGARGAAGHVGGLGVSTASASPSRRSTTHLSTRLLSPKPGHRNLPSSSLRNQLTWKIFGSLVAVACPMSSQCPSSRPCCSRRRAAWRTGRGAATPTAPSAAAVCLGGDRGADEDAVLPVVGLVDQRDVGGAAAAEEDRRDRDARRVVPLGGDRSGTAWPATVNRAFGCAAGRSAVRRPVVALPVDQVRGLLLGSCPPTTRRRRRSGRRW
jgi:hypothetical protein